MTTPFPGMDPYLEQRGLWEEVHTQLIVDMARALNRQVSPKYRVAIEQRSYMSLRWSDELVGMPDVGILNGGSSGSPATLRPILATSVTPLIAELPMPDEQIERYLEIRDASNDSVVITAIELLSPTNKIDREGREIYTRKRLRVLGSMTNLVEIDLLRVGQPLEMRVQNGRSSDYRIVISRSLQRPRSDLYAFNVRDPIPIIPIPLRHGEGEPTLDLNQLLHSLYESLSYERTIDYHRNPEPPLRHEDAIWADRILMDAGLR